MTDHAASASQEFVDVAPASPALFSDPFSFRISMVICLALAALLGFGRAQTVWASSAFFDSDDAMRAVQVRDFLAGQSWFDLSASRIDPPNGFVMHWSRIVDIPLAAMMKFFSLFMTPDHSERATRLVFPFALLGALFAAVASLASILADKAVRPAAVWLTLLSGAVFLQFTPGRIDHHAPQIVTLVLTMCFLLQGLAPARATRLAPAAMLMALSVAISLENLPFIVVMIAALPVLFIITGEGAPLRAFAAGAIISFPALYGATVPQISWLVSACDAYSFVHLAALIVGATGLAALGFFACFMKTPGARFFGVLLVGGATTSAVAMIAPRCVGDPLGVLDPLLRDLWLSHVAEAWPISAFYAKMPNIVIATATPVLFGLIAAAFFASSAQDSIVRRRHAVLAAVIAVGFVGGLWQMRVFTSVTPLAMAPLAVAVVSLVRRLPVSGALRAGVATMLAAIISPVGLAAALPAPDVEEGAERGCLTPQHFAALANLDKGSVLGSFDLGAHVTAYTQHSVFAAPYHRNNHGNLIAAHAFMSEPAEAEKMLRNAGANYVIWCAKQKPLSPLAARAPNGLAAMLARGEAPAWLERKSADGAKLLVFALKPSEH